MIHSRDNKSPDSTVSFKLKETKCFEGFSCSMTDAQINDLMGLCN